MRFSISSWCSSPLCIQLRINFKPHRRHSLKKPNDHWVVALKMEDGSRAMWFIKRRRNTMLFSIDKYRPPDDHYFSRVSTPIRVTQVEACISITLVMFEEMVGLWGHPSQNAMIQNVLNSLTHWGVVYSLKDSQYHSLSCSNPYSVFLQAASLL